MHLDMCMYVCLYSDTLIFTHRSNHPKWDSLTERKRIMMFAVFLLLRYCSILLKLSGLWSLQWTNPKTRSSGKKILRVNIYLCPTKIRNFHPGRFLTSHNSSLEGIPLIFNGILDWLCLLSMLFWVQFCFLGADVLAQLSSTM